MSQKKYRIGFIGNFMPNSPSCYSTECDRKWSFEKLGHRVIPFQENETNQETLNSYCDELDMLVYSHTHDPSYVIEGLRDTFEYYKSMNVPTVSVHLDRWAWLDRVKDVGKEATWFTEFIFMADGSPEAVELYEKHNLNWHYLKPGVVERECVLDVVPMFNGLSPFKHYEIVFTGSRGYHPEYPFRPKLIDFLKKTYGDRFGHFGNDGITVARGADLNAVYQKAKIVVGDSCFGGRPRYVSDRYYETRGRGGFLVHPYVEGIDRHGVAPYTHGDLNNLKEVIDYWLEHDDLREGMRSGGHEWVKNNETYTQRAQTILDTVFP